jgi:hypothetical protein
MLEMVQWAKAHDLAIYFTLMPRLGDQEPSSAYLAKFERTFGVPLLFPPKEILGQLYDGGYSDPNHLHEPGRELYSQWLGTQLR